MVRCVRECHEGTLGRFNSSGGGLTISGREPTLQIEFAEDLLKKTKEAGIDCAVETCGFCHHLRLERVQPYVDLFLYDIKDTDEQKHRASTGFSNKRSLSSLRKLVETGTRI